jgi:hypothetical protein
MAMGRLCTFIMVPVAACRDPKMNRTDLAVLGILYSFWASTGHAFPSVALLAERSATSDRSIQRSLQKLKLEGWIKVSQNHKGSTSRYFPGRKFAQGDPIVHPGKGGDKVVTPVTSVTRSRSTTPVDPEALSEAEIRRLPPLTDEFYGPDDRLKQRPRCSDSSL